MNNKFKQFTNNELRTMNNGLSWAYSEGAGTTLGHILVKDILLELKNRGTSEWYMEQ